MRLRKLIQGAIAGMALSITGAAAETPKDTLVVADAIDDVITLDPGEVSEIGAGGLRARRCAPMPQRSCRQSLNSERHSCP